MSDPNRIAEFSIKVVLPGVGRVSAMPLSDSVEPDLGYRGEGALSTAGKPFLGICLGLQMLFTRGHEDGIHQGLDLYPGDVVRFPAKPGLKVPHMGWNTLRGFTRPGCPPFRELPADPAVYFTHSYYAEPKDCSVVRRRRGRLLPTRSASPSGGTTIYDPLPPREEPAGGVADAKELGF